MDEHCKISVIVPVYNAEKYLRECLDSLINQDLPKDEYEIILVNDGSTDGSLLICEEYAGRYCCIKLFSQENQGVSVARNVGIQHALGEYVMFVDADDFIGKKSLSVLLDGMKSSLPIDIIFYGTYLYVSDDVKKVNNSFKDLKRNIVYKGDYFVSHINDFDSVCQSLFRRRFLEENGLLFVQGITRGEDSEFTMKSYAFAERVVVLDLNLYYYRCVGESATRTRDVRKLKANFKSSLMVASSISDFIDNRIFSAEVRRVYRKRVNSMLISFFMSMMFGLHGRDRLFEIECFNYIRAHNLLPMRGVTLSWKTTMFVPLINSLYVLWRFFLFKFESE